MMQKQQETEEYLLVIEAMAKERKKMPKGIVFPAMLANATYKALESVCLERIFADAAKQKQHIEPLPSSTI